jgi:hypothetical protein
MLRKSLSTGDSKTYILLHFISAAVFLSAGIRKFLFTEAMGA